MREFKKGMLAKSKAGHDAGRLYVIMKADSEYVYLADGTLRTLERLKKKRRRHIQIIFQIPRSLKLLMEENQELRDEHIKRAIKEYKNQQEV